MKIKLDITGFIALGALIAVETITIGKLTEKYIKQCVRANTAEKKCVTMDRALDLYEMANGALSREIEELEKKLES